MVSRIYNNSYKIQNVGVISYFQLNFFEDIVQFNKHQQLKKIVTPFKDNNNIGQGKLSFGNQFAEISRLFFKFSDKFLIVYGIRYER